MDFGPIRKRRGITLNRNKNSHEATKTWGGRNVGCGGEDHSTWRLPRPTTLHFPSTRHSVLSNLHCSNAKIRFQSFFMLITDQPFFFAWAISASLNVPTLDFGP